jgi:hypothetical protein
MRKGPKGNILKNGLVSGANICPGDEAVFEINLNISFKTTLEELS